MTEFGILCTAPFCPPHSPHPRLSGSLLPPDKRPRHPAPSPCPCCSSRCLTRCPTSARCPARCPCCLLVVPHDVSRDVRCPHDVRAMSVLSAPRPPETEPRAGELAERGPRRRRVSDTSRTPRSTSITLSSTYDLFFVDFFPDNFPCFLDASLTLQ